MCTRSNHVGAVLLRLQLVASPLWAYSGAVFPPETDLAQATVVPPSMGSHEPTTLRVGVDSSGMAELTKASSVRLMRRAGLSEDTGANNDQEKQKASLPVDASVHFVGASFSPAANPSLRSDSATVPLAALVEIGADSQLTKQGGSRHHHTPTKRNKGGAKLNDFQSPSDEGDASSDESALSQEDVQQEDGADTSDDPGAGGSSGIDESSDDSSLPQNDMQQKGDADTSDDPGAGDGSGIDESSDVSSLPQNDMQHKGDADTSDDPGEGDGSGGDVSSDDSALSQNDMQQNGDADMSADPGAGDGSGVDASSDDSSSESNMQQKGDADTTDDPGAGGGSGGDASSDDSSLSQEDMQQGSDATNDDPGASDSSGEDASSDDSSLSQEDADTNGDPRAGDGSGGDAPSDDSSLSQVKREDIIKIPKGSETSGGDSASDDSSLSQDDGEDKGELASTDDLGDEVSPDDSSLLQQENDDKDGSQNGDPLGGNSSGLEKSGVSPEEQHKFQTSSLTDALPSSESDVAQGGGEVGHAASLMPENIAETGDSKDTAGRNDDESSLALPAASSLVDLDVVAHGAAGCKGCHPGNPRTISEDGGSAKPDVQQSHTSYHGGAQREYYPDEGATQQKRAFSDGPSASRVEIAKTEAANARRAMEYQVKKAVDRTIAEALRNAKNPKDQE